MSDHSVRDFAGRLQWDLLHTYAVTYTPDKRESAKKYVEGLAGVFPCEKCRRRFNINLQKIPLNNYLQNNRTFFLWTYLMHDAVNIEKGVKSPPYNQTRDFWFNKIGVECKECKL